MPNQITGKILYIYPSQQIPSKDGSKTYVKRSLVMDCTRFDPYTGERGFENTPMVDFFGDKCQELDQYQVGQIVTVTFDVQGTRYTNRDGVEQIFTRINPYRIERREPSRSPSKPAQQPAPQQAQQPAIPATAQAAPQPTPQSSPWGMPPQEYQRPSSSYQPASSVSQQEIFPPRVDENVLPF